MAWKEKVAGKVTFDEVGMEVVGKITDIKPQKMATGEVNSYTLLTAEGETLSLLGTTVLDRLIGHELNSLVRITYLGKTKTGAGREMKNFKIEVWEEELQPTVADAELDQEPAKVKKARK